MSYAVLLVKRVQGCSSPMPSLAVMLSQHSVAKGRNLLRKPGMFVIRLPVLSANSASTHPPIVDDEDLNTLERFVIVYDRSSTAEGVDDARLDMFARKQMPYKTFPQPNQHWRSM